MQTGIEDGQGGDDGDTEQRAAQDIQPAGREELPERLGQRHAAQVGQGHGRGQQQEHPGRPQQRRRRIAQPEIGQGRRAGRQRDEDGTGAPEIETRMHTGCQPDQEHPRQTGHEQMLPGKGQTVGKVAGIEGLHGGRFQQEAFPEEQGQQDGLALGHRCRGRRGRRGDRELGRGCGRQTGGRSGGGRQKIVPARQEHGKELSNEFQTLPGKGGGGAVDGGLTARAPAPDAPAGTVAVPPEAPIGEAEVALGIHGQQLALQANGLARQREGGGLLPCPGKVAGKMGQRLAVRLLQMQVGQADAQALFRQGAYIAHPGFQHRPVAGRGACLVQLFQHGRHGKSGQQGLGRDTAQQGDGTAHQQAGETPQTAVRHQDAKTRAKRGSGPACRQQAQQPA